MTGFTLAVNGSFVFLILTGIFVGMKWGFSREFIMNFVLAVIASPLIAVTLMRTMKQNENQMLAADAMHRINEILSMKPLDSPEELAASPEESCLEVRSVSFSYGKGRSKQALSDVSISLDAGKTLALVGHSGGGKSTLAKLTARFFDPDSGRIMIGGVDIKALSPEELSGKISFVFQDSRLIKGSILDNVKLSRPDADIAEVMKALNMACCDDIIAKFPEGVNTIIGSEGVYLSGGEVQRLTIARAFLKDAPVIILDEAAAYADPDNEQKIQEAVKNLARDKTVIMIAHRLSGVKNADVIAVLEGGRIVESGNFDELISRDSKFRALYQEYQASINWHITQKGEDK